MVALATAAPLQTAGFVRHVPCRRRGLTAGRMLQLGTEFSSENSPVPLRSPRKRLVFSRARGRVVCPSATLASSAPLAAEAVRMIANSCASSPGALLVQTSLVFVLSLVAQKLVRALGIERMLYPEGAKVEDSLAESLKRAGLEPSPVAASTLHNYLTHPLRTWIQWTANFVVACLVAHYFSANGRISILGVDTAQTLEAAQRFLVTLWRAVTIACCAWMAMVWEKEAFSRLARRDPLDAPALGAASKLVRRGTFVAAALLMMDVFGISLKALLAFGGVGGLAIGLASQVVASNIVSGASLLASRIFREGDKIDIVGRNAIGFVERFGIANTQLRLEDGSPYVIPNGELTKSAIRNLSRLSHRRILATFRVPYDAMPKLRDLVRRMELYLLGREEVEDCPAMRPTRVVDEYALVISVQTFIPAPGMSLVQFDRLKSEILLDLGEMITRSGVPLEYPRRSVSPAMPVRGGGASGFTLDGAVLGMVPPDIREAGAI